MIYTGGRYSKIKMITNATTATFSTVDIVDKQGTNIPDDISVYTALREVNNPNIAIIGTERGVYKTDNFASPAPTWESYNNGINLDVPIFKLYQQTNDIEKTYSVIYDPDGTPKITEYQGVLNYGVIYAATYGLGIFVDSTYHTVGINQYPDGIKHAAGNGVKVYPNPANSSINVDYTLQSTNNVQLNILDITGRTVYTENLGAKETGTYTKTVDCSQFSNGFYFVNIIIGKQNKTAKFVINR